ncbi:hypothetical protein [Umezawaea sp. Da 62-37]|uniref:hypothetical protein n=1 Tax=Umezawaea sp. Da 62-37 TaxID=3075927 RepID=UPI0028F7200D|nr:hypothetical protein [Umezawaea sp. Da 62-37]WNV90319.1 hypothetical protein RM788_19170 [Umezawaea sp. Da 62-37]
MGIQIINAARPADTPHAQAMLSGGGARSGTTVGVRWSDRFLVIGLGRSTRWSRDGVYEINMPPDGTVIPCASGGASVTVASGRVPVPFPYGALWYIPPIGLGQGSVPENFRITRFGDPSPWEVPDHWILIASRNDDGQAALYKWGDGATTDYWRLLTLLNGWTNYGTEWSRAMYRRGVGDLVEVRGLVMNGTANHVGTLPAGFRPATTLLTVQNGADLFARVDINNIGQIIRLTGSSSYLTLNLMFHAEQ